MNDRQVVVGAGPVGRHVAKLLADRGSEVAVLTRSGTSTEIDGVQHIAADASDSEALTDATKGASVLYNCANPGDYTSWARVWPPLAKSFLTAAQRSGAVLATTSSLYPYGPVDGPMIQGLPDAATDTKGRLRAEMWAAAHVAHVAGRLRATEVRGSDYVGSGIGTNGHISRQLPTISKGKRAWVMGSADQPHTFTDVLDVARTLIAAAADDNALGKAWHVPSNPARTQRQAITDVLAAMGRPPVAVSAIPGPVLRAVGLVSPLVREINALSYQWTRPYVLDDQEARKHFDITPTPWDEVCRRTAQISA